MKKELVSPIVYDEIYKGRNIVKNLYSDNINDILQDEKYISRVSNLDSIDIDIRRKSLRIMFRNRVDFLYYSAVTNLCKNLEISADQSILGEQKFSLYWLNMRIGSNTFLDLFLNDDKSFSLEFFLALSPVAINDLAMSIGSIAFSTIIEEYGGYDVDINTLADAITIPCELFIQHLVQIFSIISYEARNIYYPAGAILDTAEII